MSLNHVGTQLIETKRLILRKFQLDDAEQMYNNWAKDPENTNDHDKDSLHSPCKLYSLISDLEKLKNPLYNFHGLH